MINLFLYWSNITNSIFFQLLSLCLLVGNLGQFVSYEKGTVVFNLYSVILNIYNFFSFIFYVWPLEVWLNQVFFIPLTSTPIHGCTRLYPFRDITHTFPISISVYSFGLHFAAELCWMSWISFQTQVHLSVWMSWFNPTVQL